MSTYSGRRFISFVLLLLVACGSDNTSRIQPQPQPQPQSGQTTLQPTRVHIDEQGYINTVYVDAAYDPAQGRADTYITLDQALEAVKNAPGTKVIIRAGVYYGATRVLGLRGTADLPFGIYADGEVIMDGGRLPVTNPPSLLHLQDPAHVVIEGLTFRNTPVHAVNVDDAGSFDSPALHIIMRDIKISNTGTVNKQGNIDCMKLSGVDYFEINGADFSDCGHGELIDMVGCHYGTIQQGYFHDHVANGIQAKGASLDILLRGNLFENIAGRNVQGGGSTDATLYRPRETVTSPENGNNVIYESRGFKVFANVFMDSGGGGVVAFTGCYQCLFAQNTLIRPSSYYVWVVQEQTDQTLYLRGRENGFYNNIIVFNRADTDKNVVVNVGGNTLPSQHYFGSNLWYALDDPEYTGPDYPASVSLVNEPAAVADPVLDGGYVPAADGPAQSLGSTVIDPVSQTAYDSLTDYSGRAYASPPTVGAFEIPMVSN